MMNHEVNILEMSHEAIDALVIRHSHSNATKEYGITNNEAQSYILALIQILGTTTRRNLFDLSHYELNREKVIHDIRTGARIPEYEIVNTSLDYPRTVCTSERCIGIENGETFYQTVCHEHCLLQNIPIASFPEEGLKRCDAMNKNTENCYRCGCSYKKHMHIKFEQQIRSTFSFSDFVDTVGSVYNFFFRKKEEKFLKTQVEAEMELKNREKQLDMEQDKITNALTIFAAFLRRRNPYTRDNNDVENLLELQIRNAKVIAKETKNDDVVNRLVAVQEAYGKKYQMIRDSDISTNVIFNVKQELFDLPINGNIIKDSFKRTYKH